MISCFIDWCKIVFDHSRSDGSPQKLMDSSRLNSLGWNAKVELEVGLKMTYSDFLKNYNKNVLIYLFLHKLNDLNIIT